MAIEKDGEGVPIQYLNSENPFSFAKGYFNDEINNQKSRERLNAIQKLQPEKLDLFLDSHQIIEEKKTLLENGLKTKRDKFIRAGLEILQVVDPVDNPLELFERHLDNEEILDIAVEIRKIDLAFPQMRIRSRVFQVIQSNFQETINLHEPYTYDNLREAMLFEKCKWKDEK
ncbi:hypothetical protein A0H76_248 [Hepatospora eriocheir]|uniref:Uncharacterized protein n=1 Tax=Hepatospora eriocheir TaxID=1081669 RepID=A0A1X0QLI1_9MICR|nr:hypothetical protein A0H76_248 [Hepatospora eriocheir]